MHNQATIKLPMIILEPSFGLVHVRIYSSNQPYSILNRFHRLSIHTKYRLVYVVNDERILGYDNERGKGDHKHTGKSEPPYRFTSPAQLMADFMKMLTSR
jgi:hypothetical protein